MTDHLVYPKKLLFDSAEKCVGLTGASKPHDAQVGQWRVFETLIPHPDDELRENGLGAYRVSMEREVSTQREVWMALDEACRLAKEIDVAWCYAWGKPYHAVISTVTSYEAPDGWSGNLRQVEQQIQREMGRFYVAASQIVQRRGAWWPCFPLKRVLAARQAIVKAPPVLADLIELHICSHKSADDGELFFLAKALELVGGFFAQRPREPFRERHPRIETAMRKLGIESTMTQNITWLFRIANERSDVRHAWNISLPGVVPHPRMTDQERAEFVFNADLVIRAFVCDRLGLDVHLITIKQGATPKAGKWRANTLVFED